MMPVIAAAVFATGNTVTHAIRGDINNVGDFFKYFSQGAVTGFVLGCAWQFAPLIPWAGNAIQTGNTVDSRAFGLSYLFAIGIPSLISASKKDGTHSQYWTETRANRRADKYFRKYFNVNWNYPRYPLR